MTSLFVDHFIGYGFKWWWKLVWLRFLMKKFVSLFQVRLTSTSQIIVFALLLLSRSLSKTSLSLLAERSSSTPGSFERISLPNNNLAGLTPVVVCGVLLLPSKNFCNYFRQSRLSLCATRIPFSRLLFSLYFTVRCLVATMEQKHE